MWGPAAEGGRGGLPLRGGRWTGEAGQQIPRPGLVDGAAAAARHLADGEAADEGERLGRARAEVGAEEERVQPAQRLRELAGHDADGHLVGGVYRLREGGARASGEALDGEGSLGVAG